MSLAVGMDLGPLAPQRADIDRILSLGPAIAVLDGVRLRLIPADPRPCSEIIDLSVDPQGQEHYLISVTRQMARELKDGLVNGDPGAVSRILDRSFDARRDYAAILDTPEKIFFSRVGVIQRAKRSLDSADFLVRNDDATRIKMALMRQAAVERRVAVRSIADALHQELDPAMIKHLMERGVQFKVFNPPGLKDWGKLAVRYHEKGLGRDGEENVAGDTNSGDEYFQWGRHEKMTSRDILVRGPSAKRAQRHFDRVWESSWVSTPSIEVASAWEVRIHRALYGARELLLRAAFRAIRFPVESRSVFFKPRVRKVTRPEVDAAGRELDWVIGHWRELAARKWTESRGRKPEQGADKIELVKVGRPTYVHHPAENPGADAYPGMERNLLNVIRRTRKTLLIATPYLVLTPEFEAELKDAIARGVKVKILTNSARSSDNKMTQAAYERSAPKLAAMGLEIWEYDGPETMHAKLLASDGRYFYLGSYNMDNRSQKFSMENGYIVPSAFLARSLVKIIEADLERSVLVAGEGKLLAKKPVWLGWVPWIYSILAKSQL